MQRNPANQPIAYTGVRGVVHGAIMQVSNSILYSKKMEIVVHSKLKTLNKDNVNRKTMKRRFNGSKMIVHFHETYIMGVHSVQSYKKLLMNHSFVPPIQVLLFNGGGTVQQNDPFCPGMSSEMFSSGLRGVNTQTLVSLHSYLPLSALQQRPQQLVPG